MNSLSEANTHFAWDLFQQFKISKKDGNIFYAPLSISAALAMAQLGAKGNTALEIRKVFHFNEATEENMKGTTTTDHVEKLGNVHHQFQKLLTELKKPTDAYELNIANKFYGENKYPFLQEYVDNVKKFYLASVESVDFMNAAEESRKKINSWVESQTNGKIKDMFLKKDLDSTILVLVNAIYFKGQWDKKFDKKNTVEEKFWLNKDTSKPVQMMKQYGVFNFTTLEDAQAQILEIPYKGKDLSMMLLLPNEVDGLQKLEDQLTAEKLTEWTSSQNMSENWVDLSLPRFKMEEGYDLKNTLTALGMVEAFSPRKANFSGMAGNLDLAVSEVIHKSFVEVAEEGAEAAASTVVVVGVTSPRSYRFHCDHPFLFFIKHNKTNGILFLGRVSCP